jgi:hypothetical protein
MTIYRTLLRAALAAVALSGCATEYGPEKLTGGYSDKELQPGIWRIVFAGNGYTTAETVQTYWLYHVAQLSLSKGYDGFLILSPLTLANLDRLQPDAAPGGGVIKVKGGGGGYVATYSYSQMAKPLMRADVQFLHKPFTPIYSKLFDSADLKLKLQGYVEGAKCGGNVCPHVHSYLYPVLPTARP